VGACVALSIRRVTFAVRSSRIVWISAEERFGETDVPDHVTIRQCETRACVSLRVRYAQKHTAVNCSAVMVANGCFPKVLITRFYTLLKDTGSLFNQTAVVCQFPLQVRRASAQPVERAGFKIPSKKSRQAALLGGI